MLAGVWLGYPEGKEKVAAVGDGQVKRDGPKKRLIE